ncbi:hypothetical protein [Pararhizobium capsulatum]|uniref:hypothetical protein n=1 Tax=Pararhizobium capsulatum TaxID=34014 RepID=UPI0027D84682|nr:hypothetical protein [Pararhizobium capsulatum]
MQTPPWLPLKPTHRPGGKIPKTFETCFVFQPLLTERDYGFGNLSRWLCLVQRFKVIADQL